MASILGELELLVLLAVLRLGKQAYAVTIHEEIETRANVRLARGTVYVTLGRLEKKGYLSSWFSEPTPQRGGKSKRFFKVDPSAMRLLRQSRRALENMWTDLDLDWDPVAERP